MKATGPNIVQRLREGGLLPRVLGELLGRAVPRRGTFAIHCFRPEQHAHGDRSPSLIVKPDVGRVTCAACGLDLGLLELACERWHLSGPAEAAAELQRRYFNGHVRPVALPAEGIPSGDELTDLVRSYRRDLASRPDLRDALLNRFAGLTASDLDELGIGLDCYRSTPRYALPALAADRESVVAIKYRTAPGFEKVKPQRGHCPGALLGIDRLAGRKSSPVLLLAGERDLLEAYGRMREFVVVSVTTGEGTSLAPWAMLFAGREVTVAYDADAAGRRNAPRRAAELAAAGARPKVLDLSPLIAARPNHTESHKDLSDFFGLGGTAEELREAISRTPECAEAGENRELGTETAANARRPLPTIRADDGDLARTADAAWEAVQQANDPPFLFRRAGVPVRLGHDDDGGAVVESLTQDRLRHELARAATWIRGGGKEGRAREVPARPPVDVVRDMLARPDPPFPLLTRVVAAPVFGPDGALVTAPGYHRAGCVFYLPAPGFAVPEVPERPSPDDLERARKLIVEELLGGFPFVGEAERAHAIALLLHPFLRDLIRGPTPLHLIEKPSVGTGATLLAEVLAYPALGGPVPLTTEGRDDDEWRKRITAKLLRGPAFFVVDNLRRRLDTAQLSTALTAEVWEDRILGFSEVRSIPVRCAWAATGNNPALSNEIARRTVRIRLDAKTDQPWRGRSFRHPELRPWTRDHRGEIVWASLTLARAWIESGRPVPPGLPVLGRFEDWCRVLGGVLHTAGIPGFLGNLDEFYESSDAESASWRAFVRAWWDRFEGHEVGVAELFGIAASDESPLDLGDGGERSQKTRLGKWLSGARDRQFEGLRIVEGGTLQRARRWRLVRVETGPR